MKEQAKNIFRAAQNSICDALSLVDGGATFASDLWQREDHDGGHGGGGDTRILRNGKVFEQAGVNFSEVYGTLPQEMLLKLGVDEGKNKFYATGTSLVVHPNSPLVPTVHANFRYLKVGDKVWFGGGMDLTPYYLFKEDATHFHSSLKEACDKSDQSYYAKFKADCDKYFYLPHRGETRGVGGIFYDYLGKDDPENLEKYFKLSSHVSLAFNKAYCPIVEQRKNEGWTAEQKRWQLLRRGRYVEFNLIYDRGTLFGLKTGGRTESILMSLPPEVAWEYDYQAVEGSEEARLLEVLRSPKEWA